MLFKDLNRRFVEDAIINSTRTSAEIEGQIKTLLYSKDKPDIWALDGTLKNYPLTRPLKCEDVPLAILALDAANEVLQLNRRRSPSFQLASAVVTAALSCKMPSVNSVAHKILADYCPAK